MEEAGKGKERAYERFWPSSSKAKENGERPQSSWKEEREACVGRREGSVKSGGGRGSPRSPGREESTEVSGPPEPGEEGRLRQGRQPEPAAPLRRPHPHVRVEAGGNRSSGGPSDGEGHVAMATGVREARRTECAFSLTPCPPTGPRPARPQEWAPGVRRS